MHKSINYEKVCNGIRDGDGIHHHFAQSKTDSLGQADKLKKELALDDVQYKSVKAIAEQYAEKMADLRKDPSLSKESRQEQMKALHLEKDAAIKKVLSSEQSAKWTSLRSEERKRHKGRANRLHEDHAVRMQKSLSLTDEQTAKIKTIDDEFHSKFGALKKDSTLAREDARDKGRQLRKEYQTKMKVVLTDEQIVKWEAQQAKRRKRKH